MIDLRGVPTNRCICGSDIFRIIAKFDDEYEICMYALEAECWSCGAKLTAPTPLDLPHDV
jgi:hypothetical protein